MSKQAPRVPGTPRKRLARRSLSLSLPRATAERLDALAKARGVSRSHIVRELIEAGR